MYHFIPRGQRLGGKLPPSGGTRTIEYRFFKYKSLCISHLRHVVRKLHKLTGLTPMNATVKRHIYGIGADTVGILSAKRQQGCIFRHYPISSSSEREIRNYSRPLYVRDTVDTHAHPLAAIVRPHIAGQITGSGAATENHHHGLLRPLGSKQQRSAGSAHRTVA